AAPGSRGPGRRVRRAPDRARRSRAATAGDAAGARTSLTWYWPMVGERPLRILMLTTSYPPAEGVPNGGFVHRLAARVGGAGDGADVRAPREPGAVARVEDGVRSHFFRYAPGRLERLAYGPGVMHTLSHDRRLLALVPPLAGAFAIAAARLARRADVVHGHWLPAGMVARSTLRPCVTTVPGADLALARPAAGP